MSYLNVLIPDCPDLQLSLGEVFANCLGNGMFQDRLTFLNFLTSEANNNRLQKKIIEDNGKIQRVQLTYNQRLDHSIVTRNVSNPKCDATGSKGTCVTVCDFDVEQNFNIACEIDSKNLRRNCQSNPSYVQEQILGMIDLGDRQASKDLAALAVASIGNWASDVVSQDGSVVAPGGCLLVKTRVAVGSEQLSAFTHQTIQVAAMQTGYCDQKVIFAGLELYNYYLASLSGCCSSFGSDLSAAWANYGHSTSYDRDILEAFGGDNSKGLLTQPGALQLLTYVQAGWDNGIAGISEASNYYHTAIVSPKTGLPYDLIMTNDCGIIKLNLIGTFSLKTQPADVFATGDIYEGVNFVNCIMVDNTL